MFKLIFYVPESHKESVKQAVFATGAGTFPDGHYDQCSWEILGTGQFRPLQGATPYLGAVDAVESVPEYRVEILVSQHCLAAAKSALIEAHPYEAPAFEIIQLFEG